MKKVVLSLVAGLALAFVAKDAMAQSGKICQLNGGVATLKDGGIPGAATPLAPASLDFTFKGSLANCQGSGPANGSKVCSKGRITGATCSANAHSGGGVVCAGDCWEEDPRPTSPTKGQPACKDGAPIDQSTFSGRCTGSNCSGTTGTPSTNGWAYTLFFDQATIQNALAQCDNTPGALTSATFSGALAYGN
ncbi:MAG: hypothetical protein QOD06_2253 [Candidatus Binatota bacterium]|jgi:hypothetical protein|nr:hypothetical protein [Candidatus Binatota bacterium]